MKYLITCLMAILCTLSTYARLIEVDDIYYNVLDSNLVEVTYQNPQPALNYPQFKSINIPSQITSDSTIYHVVGVGSNAFSYCDSLQSIYLPNSIVSIGDSAFFQCELLDSIIIPDRVSSIGKRVFAKCTNLAHMSVAEGNTTYDSRGDCNAIIESVSNTLLFGCQNTIIPTTIEHIADWAFWGCVHMKSICVSEGVQSIGDSTFLGCDSITSVVWNAKDYPDLSSEEENPFKVIREQIISFVIGDSVSYVANYLCSGMSALQQVTVGKNVLCFGEYTFNNCSSLSSIVWNARHCMDFALKSWEAPYNAFLVVYDQITSFIFGEEVEHIPRLLCYNMYRLSSVVLHNNVRTIGMNAFRGTNRIDVSLYANSIDEFLFNNLNQKLEKAMNYRNVHLFIDSALVTEIVIPDSIVLPNEKLEYLDHETNVRTPIHDYVIAVDDYEFADCIDLISISLPRTIKSIGDAAFEKCKKLQSIIIPDGLTSIGDAAFEDCEMLKSITIPENVTSIGTKAFFGCDSLSICWNAKKCSSNQLGFGVKSCIFGDSVEYIPPKLLQGINSLVSVTLPKGLTVIEDKFFQNCTSLSSVTIPDGVIEIGSYAFQHCVSLSSINIPSSVLNFGYNVFDGCYNLHSVTYELSNVNIAFGNEFQFCRTFEFKDGVIWIPYDLCTRLRYLTSVTIPKSVTGIQYNAFYGTALYDDSARWEDGVLYIGDCLIAAKSSLSGHYNIKEGTRLIADGAFGNCTNLTSITIPNSVKYIGHNVFYRSGILANESYWTGGALYIDNCLIKTNSDLPKNYVIPSYTRVIASGAFEGRYYLASVSIPSTITHIGNNTFAGCGSLQRIILPEGITSIGKETFSECSSLKSVYIPQSVVSIGEKAFYNCSSLKSITIPDGVKDIGRSAFAECESLSSVDFGKNLRGVGGSCFYKCRSLFRINLPNTLRVIGRLAFAECKSLHYLDLGDSLYYIGANAFNRCTSLFSVSLPNTLEIMEKGLYDTNVFEDCYSLEAIFVPRGEKQRFEGMGLKKSKLVEQDGSWNTFQFQYGGLHYKLNKRTETTIDFDSWQEITCTFWDTTVCVVPEYSADSSLENYAGITHISIPETVTHNGITYRVTGIGCGAFRNSKALISVELPSGMKFIDSYAFEGCQSLVSISLPHSMEKIGFGAFEKCSSLCSLVLPDNVTEVASNLLRGCSSLTSITIGNRVINVFSEAFAGCQSLTSITFPQSVYLIDSEVFRYSPSIESIYIHNPDIMFAADAFAYCNSQLTVYYYGTQQQWNEISKHLTRCPRKVVCLVI